MHIHVWGAIKWEGVDPLRNIQGNLNSQRYHEQIDDIHDICHGGPGKPE